MNISIRRGDARDAGQLAELGLRTFRDAFAADNRPADVEQYVALAYGESQQHAELVDPDVTTLLVDVDGQLAGYAQLRSGAAPDCVGGAAPIELWRFYVAQAWHGRGIAQTLMDRVMAEARGRDARTLWLGVWERNARAQAFYRKHGFADVGSQVFVLGSDVQTDRIYARALESG